MCLLTYQKEPKILTEDLVVYKILERDFRAYTFKHFVYKVKKLYKTVITKIEINSYEDDFLFCDDLDQNYYKPLIKDLNYKEGEIVAIQEGFHSAKSVERVKQISVYSDPFIVKCIIPAGSEYYEDETGLCVSNQIIIVEKVD